MFIDKAKSSAMAAASNNDFWPHQIVPSSIRNRVQFQDIYVYNVSKLEFKITRPPNFPRFTIKPCPENEEYVHCATFQDPFSEFEFDNEGKKRENYVDGFIEVTRALNPLNYDSTNQDFNNFGHNLEGGYANTENLNALGVFWSVNNPPTQEEIEAAHKRLRNTFKLVFDDIAKLEMRNPAEAATKANDIHHAAADYLQESTSWHKSVYGNLEKFKSIAEKSQMVYKSCPECGFDDIPSKARKCFHGSCGYRFDQELAEPVEVKTAELKPWQKAQKAKAEKAKQQ